MVLMFLNTLALLLFAVKLCAAASCDCVSVRSNTSVDVGACEQHTVVLTDCHLPGPVWMSLPSSGGVVVLRNVSTGSSRIALHAPSGGSIGTNITVVGSSIKDLELYGTFTDAFVECADMTGALVVDSSTWTRVVMSVRRFSCSTTTINCFFIAQPLLLIASHLSFTDKTATNQVWLGTLRLTNKSTLVFDRWTSTTEENSLVCTSLDVSNGSSVVMYHVTLQSTKSSIYITFLSMRQNATIEFVEAKVSSMQTDTNAVYVGELNISDHSHFKVSSSQFSNSQSLSSTFQMTDVIVTNHSSIVLIGSTYTTDNSYGLVGGSNFYFDNRSEYTIAACTFTTNTQSFGGAIVFKILKVTRWSAFSVADVAITSRVCGLIGFALVVDTWGIVSFLRMRGAAALGFVVSQDWTVQNRSRVVIGDSSGRVDYFIPLAVNRSLTLRNDSAVFVHRNSWSTGGFGTQGPPHIQLPLAASSSSHIDIVNNTFERHAVFFPFPFPPQPSCIEIFSDGTLDDHSYLLIAGNALSAPLCVTSTNSLRQQSSFVLSGNVLAATAGVAVVGCAKTPAPFSGNETEIAPPAVVVEKFSALWVHSNSCPMCRSIVGVPLILAAPRTVVPTLNDAARMQLRFGTSRCNVCNGTECKQFAGLTELSCDPPNENPCGECPVPSGVASISGCGPTCLCLSSPLMRCSVVEGTASMSPSQTQSASPPCAQLNSAAMQSQIASSMRLTSYEAFKRPTVVTVPMFGATRANASVNLLELNCSYGIVRAIDSSPGVLTLSYQAPQSMGEFDAEYSVAIRTEWGGAPMCRQVVVLTVVLRAAPLPTPALARSIAKSTAAAGMSASALFSAGAAAAAMQRSLLVFSLSACQFGGEDDVPSPADSPLQLNLASGDEANDVGYAKGTVVGNLVLLAAVVCGSLAAAAVLHCMRRTNQHAAGVIGVWASIFSMPGNVLTPLSWLIQPTWTAALALAVALSVNDSSTSVVIVAAGGLAACLAPVTWFAVVLLRSSFPLDASPLPAYPPFDPQWRHASHFVRRVRSAYLFWFAERFDWEPQPQNRQRGLFGDEVDDPIFDARLLFFEQYAALFASYRPTRQWYVLLELVASITVAGLAVAKPDTAEGCRYVAGAVAGVSVALVALQLILRPHQTKWDTMNAFKDNAMTAVSCLLVVGEAYTAADVVVMVQVYLSLVQLFVERIVPLVVDVVVPRIYQKLLLSKCCSRAIKDVPSPSQRPPSPRRRASIAKVEPVASGEPTIQLDDWLIVPAVKPQPYSSIDDASHGSKSHTRRIRSLREGPGARNAHEALVNLRILVEAATSESCRWLL